MLFLFVSVFIIKVDNTPLTFISTWAGEPIFLFKSAILLFQPDIERSVMPCYHGSTISGSQQFFSTEIAICIGKKWKESKGYRAQESHAC